MKKLIILLLLAGFAQCLSAQTWSEWFRQKKTQKKYLLQQIAALQVYADYAAKGYGIARDGLGIIGNIRKGDFSMHNNYFSSLVTVNPQIRKYQKVATIISMQLNIVQQAKHTISQLKSNQQFTTAEIGYLQKVLINLLEGCTQVLDELSAIITNNRVQMKDDERLKAIDRLYTDMQDKQTFISAFTSEAAGLSMQRLQEAGDIKTLKKLNGLP